MQDDHGVDIERYGGVRVHNKKGQHFQSEIRVGS